MRFILFGIFSVVWFGMWWWTYTCHIKGACCPQPAVVSEDVRKDALPKRDRSAKATMHPIAFEWGSAVPITSEGFEAFRDSVVGGIDENMVLEITGLYHPDEPGGTDLGRRRSNAVAALFTGVLDTRKLRIASSERETLSGSRDAPFEAATFRALRESPNVREIEDRVLVYFPFNSTSALLSPDLQAYIRDLSGFMSEDTSARLLITGHTDAYGPEKENYTLGLWRASALKDLLVERGVDPGRIDIDSEGEAKPIAPNDTPANAAKNRRVEVIIQKN